MRISLKRKGLDIGSGVVDDVTTVEFTRRDVLVWASVARLI